MATDDFNSLQLFNNPIFKIRESKLLKNLADALQSS
jgi:hypothetical protein